jgi:TRAP-type C4-dicarboxylate transport system substrate-binding protein
MLPVTEAERALVDKRVDAVYAFPQAALAFQWSAHTRYFTELELGALPACIVISLKAMDALPTAAQKAIRDAAVRLSARNEEQGRLDDAALVGGLFEKQGLIKIKPDDAFRRDFLDAAKQARDTLGPSIVPPELLSETLSWLADYRVDRR